MELLRTILTILFVSFEFSFGQGQAIVKEIEKSFNDGNSVSCLAIIVYKGTTFEGNFDSLESPYYLVNGENPENVKYARHSCKNHIFLTRNLDMIKSFDNEVLETSKSKFVIVTENDDIDTIKSKLLSKKGPFKEITNVAIVLKRSADDFSIFARNHDKSDIVLTRIWKRGRYIYEKGPIFPTDKLRNFDGKLLKVTSFDLAPFIYKESPEDLEFTAGYEIQLLKDLANTHNFNYEIETPTDGKLCWDITPNGTASGLLKDLKEGICDIGFANLYIKPEREKFIDYLTPHDHDKICFLVAKPASDPKWMDLLKPFDLTLWVTVLITLMICWAFVYIYGRFFPYAEMSGPRGMVVLIRVFFDQSDQLAISVRSLSRQIFMGVFMYMFYIITVSYRGSLNSFLTVTSIPQPIDNIHQLAKMEHMKVGSFGSSFLDYLGTSINPDLKMIKDRSVIYWDFEEAFANTSKGIMAMAQGRQFLEYNIRQRFTYGYGKTSVHVMKECVNSFQVAFAVPKNSIYKRTLDTTMSALFEAGLTNKYFNHEMDKVAKLAKEKGSEVIVKPLSLNHLTGLFLLYLIMISACIVVFSFEVSIGK